VVQGILWIAGLLAVTQTAPTQTQTPAAQESPCIAASTIRADTATVELCAGDEQLRLANATRDSASRARQLRDAADHYRRAVNLSSSPGISALALNQLAVCYDAAHLDDPAALEQVLRDLIALTPDDLAPAFRLARMQEDRGLIEAAEATLLDARHRQPDAIEPNSVLAQFYARRVTALHSRDRQTPAETFSNPGEPDANGVYRIGGQMNPPEREGVPHYPPDARAAGIKGVVQTEIVIAPDGSVSTARVVRSIPLLDEAALEAVKTWKFAPTIVNGQPVPVRMVVSVNFAP
jgi:TonB family protein